MTTFIWTLLIVEGIGCLAIALFRNNLSYGVTSALFAGWLIGGAAIDRHPFFAVPAMAVHIAIYMVVAWLVLVVSRRIWPDATERPREKWRGWRVWSMIVASYLIAYHFGAEADLVTGAAAVLQQAGLFSAVYALAVYLWLKSEAKNTQLAAAIDAQLDDMRSVERQEPGRQ